MRLSANLGFLFTDLPIADAIRAARDAGFDAVEFHDQPQAVPLMPLREVLEETGLSVLALNTFMGATKGRAALSQPDFRADFTAAQTAAQQLGARAIHVTAGIGGDEITYHANLAHALAQSQCDILIEPICAQAIPGYHLSNLAQAEAVLGSLDHPRLKLMFDWFHIANSIGAAAAFDALTRLAPQIGHVQLSHPRDRGEPLPDRMPELRDILAALHAHELTTVGLEYHPSGPVAPVVAALRAM